MTVVFVNLAQHQDRAAASRLAKARRSRASCSAARLAAYITSATRWTDILKARDRLKATGARVLGDGEPRIGAHGKPVLFLHPKDFNGALVELEQA